MKNDKNAHDVRGEVEPSFTRSAAFSRVPGFLRGFFFALLVLLFGSGCGAPRRKEAGRLVESSPSAALVREVWNAHGGAAAWRKHAAVRFAYTVDPPIDELARSSGENSPRSTRFADVAFRLDDYRHLWVTADGETKPRLVTLDQGLDLEVPGAVRFALPSIRYFLSLPLASSVGRWEFRQPLAPPDFEVPRVLEIVPLEPGAPVGPCLLELGKENALVQKFVYPAPRNAAGVAHTRTVELRDYRVVAGCRIASTRSTTDLLEGAPVAFLHEEVSNIEFLSREEADRRYPLPEETPATPVPASSPPEGTK